VEAALHLPDQLTNLNVEPTRQLLQVRHVGHAQAFFPMSQTSMFRISKESDFYGKMSQTQLSFWRENWAK
jgi:hypothetical protein